MPAAHRAAARLHRRDWLKVGSVAAAASVVPGLDASALAAGPRPTAKSVIVLFMMGGVTHHESFDPKPDAPEEIRGSLSTIDTAIPGLHFAETAPNLARIADRITWLRSFSHGDNDHFTSQAFALSGRKVARPSISTEPNIGSIVAHLQGPRNQLPGYLAVPGIARPGPPPTMLFQAGWLGADCDPFCVGGRPEQPDFTATPKLPNPPADLSERLAPPELALAEGLDLERLAQRAELKSTLDDALRQFEARQGARREAHAALDDHYRHAFELLASQRVRSAFDLSAESPQTREAYGRTKIGGRCLLARRLVEAGARFVLVDYGYDNDYGNLWDNHNAASQNHPPIGEMAKRPYHVAGIDRAFAGLITDLDQRGLLDDTLVVFLTEFGRTPKINARGGRDHWGPAGTLFFAGGGAARGRVIGATDKQGAYVNTTGYTPGDVAATIYRAVGIDPRQRIYDRQDRPHFVLPEGEVIPGVFG